MNAPLYEVGVAISLRRVDREFSAAQTACHIEPCETMEDALKVYSRYHSMMEHVRAQLQSERGPKGRISYDIVNGRD
jgi:arginyl-tRNA--protein-N-Asp/Glu arginylyltransferase